MTAEAFDLQIRDRMAIGIGIINHLPVRLPEAKPEHELPDIVQKSCTECRVPVAASPFSKLTRCTGNDGTMHPERVSPRSGDALLLAKLAPDGSRQREVANLIKAEKD